MSETTLPNRLRDAADAIEELSSLAGYPPRHISHVTWDAEGLRREARVIEGGKP